MAHFVGLDVSVKETSVCVVDDAGKVVLEQKVPTEPADIIALLSSLGVTYGRIGIEAGPLSQWLVNALTAAELPVICVETRHMKALLTAQQINKTDRNDARGIAQMMRVGLFKPVHVKTLVAQEQRMLRIRPTAAAASISFTVATAHTGCRIPSVSIAFNASVSDRPR
jgi:transposase